MHAQIHLHHMRFIMDRLNDIAAILLQQFNTEEALTDLLHPKHEVMHNLMMWYYQLFFSKCHQIWRKRGVTDSTGDFRDRIHIREPVNPLAFEQKVKVLAVLGLSGFLAIRRLGFTVFNFWM